MPALALLLVLLVLAGCGAAGSDTKPKVDDTLSTAEATAVFKSAQERLPMPTGTPWRPLRVTEGEYRVAYTQAQAVSAAESQWICAWEKEWLASRSTSSARANAALQHLQQVPTLDEYKVQYGPELKNYYDQLLIRAQLGDASPIRKEVEVNCA